MKTYTTSIFVELEIKVSGTLPSTDPSGWEDVTVGGIVSHQARVLSGRLCRRRREMLPQGRTYDGLLGDLLTQLRMEFSEEIEAALDGEVPDGPDPDDARDARIDEELRG